MAKARPTTIAEYKPAAPKGAQKALREMRAILKEAAPRATEGLKWGSHLSFMPTPSAMKPFKKELAKYETGKGSIQFAYDKPLPRALIRRIAARRVKELREKDIRWM
jgi:uncharacterized protein YdhG (YjbR/CyaY superfamily)